MLEEKKAPALARVTGGNSEAASRRSGTRKQPEKSILSCLPSSLLATRNGKCNASPART